MAINIVLTKSLVGHIVWHEPTDIKLTAGQNMGDE